MKEKGEEGREVRFEEGVGEHTHTHTQTHTHTHTHPHTSLSTVMRTIGRSLHSFGFEKTTGLTQGTTPQANTGRPIHTAVLC